MKPVASVGVRELKGNPSRYLRMVRDGNMEIDITIRGEVVARLVPARRDIDANVMRSVWQRHRELAEEIGRHLPADVSAVDAVREQRREL